MTEPIIGSSHVIEKALVDGSYVYVVEIHDGQRIIAVIAAVSRETAEQISGIIDSNLSVGISSARRRG